MCTVTWTSNDHGYQLFVNRDEKLTRPAAISPCAMVDGRVRFLAPIDAAFGGSWIAVNEHGVSLCLLNREGYVPGGCDVLSRGSLVIKLAGSRASAEAAERLLARDLSRFPSFTLAMLDQRAALVAAWDGVSCRLIDAMLPLASSSFDADGVRRRRAEQFQRFRHGAIRDFHRSHVDGPSAYSPCMHRADAKTVSFTAVEVARDRIQMSYQPGAPCEGRPERILNLWRSSC